MCDKHYECYIDCTAMKQALFKLVDQCFSSMLRDSDHQMDNTGLDASTPLTLMHLLLNMKHKIVGGSMPIYCWKYDGIAT